MSVFQTDSLWVSTNPNVEMFEYEYMDDLGFNDMATPNMVLFYIDYPWTPMATETLAPTETDVRHTCGMSHAV
jgi:hypothetical protein